MNLTERPAWQPEMDFIAEQCHAVLAEREDLVGHLTYQTIDMAPWYIASRLIEEKVMGHDMTAPQQQHFLVAITSFLEKHLPDPEEVAATLFDEIFRIRCTADIDLAEAIERSRGIVDELGWSLDAVAPWAAVDPEGKPVLIRFAWSELDALIELLAILPEDDLEERILGSCVYLWDEYGEEFYKEDLIEDQLDGLDPEVQSAIQGRIDDMKEIRADKDVDAYLQVKVEKLRDKINWSQKYQSSTE